MSYKITMVNICNSRYLRASLRDGKKYQRLSCVDTD